MKRIFIFLFSAILCALVCDAQIGYQVALMDQSTGMPRANETVTVTVKITDNAGTEICSTTQSATTNDFGMLSLQVGDADSFNNTDWSKLPLWVSATVGGVTIGKSQILNIPVAEHAKHWGVLTKEILTNKTWRYERPVEGLYPYEYIYTFRDDGTFIYVQRFPTGGGGFLEYIYYGSYVIQGNIIGLACDDGIRAYVGLYMPEKNMLLFQDECYK